MREMPLVFLVKRKILLYFVAQVSYNFVFAFHKMIMVIDKSLFVYNTFANVAYVFDIGIKIAISTF